MSPFRAVNVSFVGRGQRHSVDVDAETAYEAACLAIKAFSKRRWIDGPSRHATLELEIQKPAQMLIKLRVQDVIDWLYVKPAKNSAEKVRKERLKGLLADDRR